MAACNFSSIYNNRNSCSFKYIGGTGHDLYGFISQIHLADNQFICIRVWIDLSDLSDHDLIQVFIKLCKSLHFCSGERHGIPKFLIIRFQIRYICFDPR